MFMYRFFFDKKKNAIIEGGTSLENAVRKTTIQH